MGSSLRTACAAAAAALLTAACAQGHSMLGATGTMGAATGSSPSQQMHRQMMGGMQEMQRMPLAGDVDVDFARMMRMHHLQGIEMARLQAEQGDSPEMKAMAQKIIEEQQRDVKRFDAWLQKQN